MDGERITLILRSLSISEKLLSTKTEVGETENLYLSRNISMKVYNPKEFREIREFEGIETLKNLEGQYIINGRLYGKSGSLLFFTEDFKLAIKTIRKSELECMKKIMAGYRTYLLENPKSFLCRVLGCYRISDGEGAEYFIVMKNIMKSHKVGEVYDLKGAYVRRRGYSSSSLKDMDWINNNKMIDLQGNKNAVVSQIKEDIEFLRRHRIMDYSLLICFPSGNRNHEFTSFSPLKGTQELKFGDKHDTDQEYVYLGIVDILTRWTFPKVLERHVNLLCCRTNSSCINPDAYFERFVKMLDSGFFK